MFWKKEQKKHAEKCASKECKFHGDMRILSNYMMKDCDCDGYHTFDELYDHRIRLHITLCKALAHAEYRGRKKPWKTWIHSDGTFYEGWFVLGIGRNQGHQITYHIPGAYWDELSMIKTLKKAPDFDGHTSSDVLERLQTL